MIADYYGVTLTQCTIAVNYLGIDKCCNRSVPKTCNVGGVLVEALSRNGFTSPVEPHSYVWTSATATSPSVPTPTPDYTELAAQIVPPAGSTGVAATAKPVGFVWNWGGTGSHIMVVTGVGTLPDAAGVSTNYVIVHDPAGTGNIWTLMHSYYIKSDDSRAHTLSVEYHDIFR
jgi:hypothetical protein